MGDRINAFLKGKKKYSVYIATLLASILAMVVTDPQQQAELQEFVPLAAMVLSGIVYLVVEGWNDSKRIQAEQAYYNAVAATQPGTVSAPAQAPAQATARAEERFDEAAFVKQVHTAAVELAKKAFPDAPEALTSIYRAAEAVGQKLECNDVREALAYWGYLQGLAEDAWRELEFDNKDERGCKLHPPELYEFRATLNRVNSCYEKLQALVRSGGDWRRPSSPIYGLTVYSVGAFAGEGVGE